MADANTQPEASVLGTSPFATEFVAPRLGVIHFLVWMAVAAVLLKTHMATEEIAWQPSRPPSATSLRALTGMYLLVRAAGLTGLGVLLFALARGARGRLHPGHWFLLIGTLASTGAYAFWVGTLICGMASAQSPFFVTQVLVLAFKSGMYWLAASRTRSQVGWLWCFRTFALVSGLQGLLFALSIVMAILSGWWWNLQFGLPLALTPWWSAILGLVLLVTAVLDARRRGGRDWLHWLGIGLFEVSVALTVGWWIWSSFFAVR